MIPIKSVLFSYELSPTFSYFPFKFSEIPDIEISINSFLFTNYTFFGQVFGDKILHIRSEKSKMYFHEKDKKTIICSIYDLLADNSFISESQRIMNRIKIDDCEDFATNPNTSKKKNIRLTIDLMNKKYAPRAMPKESGISYDKKISGIFEGIYIKKDEDYLYVNPHFDDSMNLDIAMFFDGISTFFPSELGEELEFLELESKLIFFESKGETSISAILKKEINPRFMNNYFLNVCKTIHGFEERNALNFNKLREFFSYYSRMNL